MNFRLENRREVESYIAGLRWAYAMTLLTADEPISDFVNKVLTRIEREIELLEWVMDNVTVY